MYMYGFKFMVMDSTCLWTLEGVWHFFWYVERVDSQLWLCQIGRDMMDLFLDMDVTLMVMLNTR